MGYKGYTGFLAAMLGFPCVRVLLGLGFRVDIAMQLAFKLTLNNTQCRGIAHDNEESQGK